MSQLLNLLSKEHVPVAELKRVYDAFRGEPGFLDEVLSAMRALDRKQVPRAVWLLTRYDRATPIDDAMIRRVVAFAPEAEHWVARAGVCQLLAATGCPEALREEAFVFLADCFRDSRTVIRVWAVSALARFRTDPAYRHEIGAMIAQAKADPGKAMQARLRRLGLVPYHRRRGSTPAD